MRRLPRILRQLVLSVTALLASLSAAIAQGPEYVPGEILVKFRQGPAGKVAATAAVMGGATPIQTFSELGIIHMSVDPNADMDAILAVLRADPSCEFAEPNYIVYADLTPNDPSYTSLWGLHNTGQTGGTADADIDAPEAWDATTGSNAVIVGIIDTGIDYLHPDLAANMWTNPGETAANGIDDDGNGYIDDVYGWDFVNNDNDPMDGHGHGTHVAGTVGAVGNNGTGVTGASWACKLVALKNLADDGSGPTSAGVAAVNYAVAMGIKLTNNSWGGGGFSTALQTAIQSANSAGMLFVAAAGNDATNNDAIPHYPCNYTVANVVSVASTDHNDQLSTFSNYGNVSVDLGAPGTSIYSTYPTALGSYAWLQGTSMATPHVAGVAALVWAADPGLTHLEVRDLLLNSVDPIPALTGKCTTGGRLNALQALPGPRAVLSSTELDFGNVSLGPGSTETLSVTVNNPGTGALTVSGVVAATDGPANASYSHDAPATPFAIPVGGSQTINVTFDPDEDHPGTVTGSLTVTHDGSSSPDVVSLTGDGAVNLSVSSVGFGAMDLRQSSSQTLTLTNPATVAINITSIVSTNSAFAADRFAFAIAPGGSEDVVVTYSARTPGWQYGQLLITHNPTIVLGLSGGTVSGQEAIPGFEDGFTNTKTILGVPFGGEYFSILLAGAYGLYALRRRR
ncbi:S8 family serine peptidase [Candidatus Latescibacterota bacterium]